MPASPASPLTVPFAVHTAKFGYDWSNVPEGMTRADLDAQYRRAIALKPEFMEPGDVVAGALAYRDQVVVFSIQIARGWDTNGRDAEYGAFAFLSYADAAKVDFGALLARDEFRTPARRPPSSIQYVGPASAQFGTDLSRTALAVLRRGETLSDFDFSRVGLAIAVYGRSCDLWFFGSVKTAAGERKLAATIRQSIDGMPLEDERFRRAVAGETHQPPATNHQPPSTNHQPPATNHQPPAPPRPSCDWLGALLWILAAALTALALFTAFA